MSRMLSNEASYQRFIETCAKPIDLDNLDICDIILYLENKGYKVFTPEELVDLAEFLAERNNHNS